MQVLLIDLETDEKNYLDPAEINRKVKKISDQLTSELVELGKQVVEISNTHDLSIKKPYMVEKGRGYFGYCYSLFIYLVG